MKKYFFALDNEKHGPFSLDELKNESIAKDTLIWYEGLDDWTPASELDVMHEILELQPPPLPATASDESVNEDPVVKENNDTTNKTTNKTNANKTMFDKPFSFEGRIRRAEYGLSFIAYFFTASLLNVFMESGDLPFLAFAYIPLLWFLWAQSAKRCHDLGNSGWFQLIPFYIFWLFFQDGKPETNQYGESPKA